MTVNSREERWLECLITLEQDPSNPSAWKELYLSLWPYTLSIIHHRIHIGRDIAEQVAQDSFLSLFTQIKNNRLLETLRANLLEPTPEKREKEYVRAFLAYLRVVCRSKVIDYQKGETSQIPLDEVLDTALDPVSHTPHPYITALSQEILQMLNEEEVELIKLYAEGFSARDIAMKMQDTAEKRGWQVKPQHFTEKSIRVIIYRVKQRIKTLYESLK